MKIYECDRCGEEYDPTDIIIGVSSFEPFYQIKEEFFDTKDKKHKCKVDLCPKCMAELKAWIQPTYKLVKGDYL